MITKKEITLDTSAKLKVVWLYGLSGSGKTTLAFECRQRLLQTGLESLVLDGDELRLGVCKDLGYDAIGRMINVCRTAELAKLLFTQGYYVFVSLMTPYAAMREAAKEIIGVHFIDVYIKCDICTCSNRDVKGLYSRARAGSLYNLPGADMEFEEPNSNSRFVDTNHFSIDECAKMILSFIS